MKIGYTVTNSSVERKKLEQAGVTSIIKKREDQTEIQSFQDFVFRRPGAEIVVVSISSIGTCLTLITLLKTMKAIKDSGGVLKVLEQGSPIKMNDRQFLDFMIHFAEIDQAAIKERTTLGLEKARLDGKIGGRPPIGQELSKRIQYLHNSEKKTLREIAEVCGVSLGTAYKYANQS